MDYVVVLVLEGVDPSSSDPGSWDWPSILDLPCTVSVASSVID